MNSLNILSTTLRTAAGAVLLAALGACGGGLDPILGGPGIGQLPTVTSTSPVASTPIATAVDVRTAVQATFSRPMQAASITNTSFTLACPAGAPVAASVAYDAPTRVATLVPSSPLPPSTTCVATVDAGVLDSTGLAMATPHTWSFVTGVAVAVDSTRPTVSFVAPGMGAADVATNVQISATFSEPMLASTLNAGSFTLMNTTLGTAVAGTVNFVPASRTAVFTPTSPATLPAGNLYTATVTPAATDLAGNALAGNTAVLPGSGAHTWTFTTGAAADTTAPTVLLVSPVSGSTEICLDRTVNATFSEPMDATSIDNTTLRVTDGGTAVPGTVSYDAASRIATFVPNDSAGFAAGRSFVVTVVSGASGVKDLAGNALASDQTWNFTTAAQPCGANAVFVPPVSLGTAASFGAFGGAAGVTNQGVQTVIGGNVGSTAACTLITGLHDASNVYTETPLNVGGVNGSINCGPPAPGTTVTLDIATQARADAQTAYDTLAAMPPGSDPGAGQLGGLVLDGGVYTAAGGTFDVTNGDLTLDAKGDANTVWVFQSAAALTVGLPTTPRRVLLINGARAANVFWQVGSAARVEDGSVMVGTIIAPAGVTLSTPGQTMQTLLTGRAIGLTASVTMVNTTIVAP